MLFYTAHIWPYTRARHPSPPTGSAITRFFYLRQALSFSISAQSCGDIPSAFFTFVFCTKQNSHTPPRQDHQRALFLRATCINTTLLMYRRREDHPYSHNYTSVRINMHEAPSAYHETISQVSKTNDKYVSQNQSINSAHPNEAHICPQYQIGAGEILLKTWWTATYADSDGWRIHRFKEARFAEALPMGEQWTGPG